MVYFKFECVRGIHGDIVRFVDNFHFELIFSDEKETGSSRHARTDAVGRGERTGGAAVSETATGWGATTGQSVTGTWSPGRARTGGREKNTDR